MPSCCSNVAVVDGPLSAFKAVSRGVHRGVDAVLVAAMVVALLLVDSLTSSVQFMIGGCAAVMAFLIWRSDYRERVKKSAGRLRRRAIRGSRPARRSGRRTGRAGLAADPPLVG